MPAIDVSTRGTEKLVRLAAAIKKAGDKDLQKALNKALQNASKPLKKSARQGALQILPYHGGLNERVAASRFTSRVTKSGSGAGLRITGSPRQQDHLDRMDNGEVRHPTFGHRPWKTQRITPGWFTKPLTLDAPEVRGELVKAMDDVARQLERDGG